MQKPDFDRLNGVLMQDIGSWLIKWLAGGQLVGHEYCCGSLRGEPGKSLKVNLRTGLWSDFATGERGGDLISLYAAINGLSQGDAFRELSPGIDLDAAIKSSYSKPTSPKKCIVPPEDAPPPYMTHYKHGAPVRSWCYRDAAGSPVSYVARYETAAGKTFCPWSWTDKEWEPRAWPEQRVLFGLDELARRPDARVLIVEGEATCEAARTLWGERFVVMTWQGGANAVLKTDWRPIHGRKVLIWPDADKAGLKAAYQIAALLTPHCPEVKLLEVME